MAFKRILCAVDFSGESLEAFRVAVEMARLYAGALHICHVIEAQPVVSDWLAINGLSDMTLQMVEKARAAMESLVASVESSLGDVSFTTEVTSGRAFVEIVNRAQEWRADLIILGAKGAASLAEIIVGSTAERVMKAASCSVLIARLLQPDAHGQGENLV
jgi:nucleotide-binding universal stress UspA family protein